MTNIKGRRISRSWVWVWILVHSACSSVSSGPSVCCPRGRKARWWWSWAGWSHPALSFLQGFPSPWCVWAGVVLPWCSPYRPVRCTWQCSSVNIIIAVRMPALILTITPINTQQSTPQALPLRKVALLDWINRETLYGWPLPQRIFEIFGAWVSYGIDYVWHIDISYGIEEARGLLPQMRWDAPTEHKAGVLHLQRVFPDQIRRILADIRRQCPGSQRTRLLSVSIGP